ncbi:MAG: hypothetical protein HY913_09615 [Desulfomonile tiedjei]|nr:hypothetical protein [Desulfomonile tiedjei]
MTGARSILPLVLCLLIASQFVHAAEKKKETITGFEVPTSGKIVDVEYRAEFDEWWVKCREGETIAVYSYDKRANRWGKIVFSPKKTEDQAKPGDKAKARPPGETESSSQEEKADTARRAPEKKPDTKSDKTKWWDPLNILKGGEKLILPPSPSEKK